MIRLKATRKCPIGGSCCNLFPRVLCLLTSREWGWSCFGSPAKRFLLPMFQWPYLSPLISRCFISLFPGKIYEISKSSVLIRLYGLSTALERLGACVTSENYALELILLYTPCFITKLFSFFLFRAFSLVMKSPWSCSTGFYPSKNSSRQSVFWFLISSQESWCNLSKYHRRGNLEGRMNGTRRVNFHSTRRANTIQR